MGENTFLNTTSGLKTKHALFQYETMFVWYPALILQTVLLHNRWADSGGQAEGTGTYRERLT